MANPYPKGLSRKSSSRTSKSESPGQARRQSGRHVPSGSSVNASASESEGDVADDEYMRALSSVKKPRKTLPRSRITSNFDPATHRNDTDSEFSDAPLKQSQVQQSQSKLFLGANAAGPSKLRDESSTESPVTKKDTTTSSLFNSKLSGIKIGKYGQTSTSSAPSPSASDSASQSVKHAASETRKVISARAQRRIDAGKDLIKREWWQTDSGVSTTFVAALKKNVFTPPGPGLLRPWGATDPIMYKKFRILAFFNYDQLCPDMHNVFAVAERAEIRVFQIHPILGLSLRHGVLDSTHDKELVRPPRRHERESFLALAWTYLFWPSKIDYVRRQQNSDFRGLPLLLAGGNCGVVKVYSADTMQVIMTLVGHGAPISSIAVSSRQPWLVVTASHDRTARVWNLMLEDAPCVAIFAGIGGHVKEVLSCAWHPTRRLIATGGVDRRIKVWAVPDSVYEEPLPEAQREEGSSPVLEPPPPTKSRRPAQVHTPIASSNIIHADHTDQVEWLDEVRLLTKARTGRTIMGRNKAGLCAEVVVWRYDLMLDLARNDPLDNGLGLGLLGWRGSEGALKLLKRFVVPRQGFWGETMAFDGKNGRIALPFQGGIWEARLAEVPLKWGFPTFSRPFNRPELDRTAPTAHWESISPAAPALSSKMLFAVAYSPDGRYAVAGGEDGVLMCWKRQEGDAKLVQAGDDMDES